MENGYDGKLAEKFSGLGINNQNGQQQTQQHVHDDHQPDNNNTNNDNLFQVMKAVEAAEATIKQQVLYLWFQQWCSILAVIGYVVWDMIN